MGSVRRSGRGRSSGQATPLVVVVLVFAALVLIGLAGLGRTASDAARADTAADAAALAAVTYGDEAAARLARTDGATLLAVRHDGDEAVVTVQVGSARSSARARLEVAVDHG